MAERARENSICLFAADFSETSQVVHFFTRDSGIVHLLAKGSKRAKSKTGGTLDLFSEGQLVFIPPRGEAMATLVEFAESTNHSGLRRRLVTINAALYMVEITSLLVAEVDPHPEAFDLMSAALRRMDQPDAPAQAVLAFYQWRLLQHVGLLGEMSNCLACGKLASGIGVHFSSHDGGLYCPDCHATALMDKRFVPPYAQAGLAVLRALDRGQKSTLTETQASAVNTLLAYHISYQLGRPLRMLPYIRRHQAAGREIPAPAIREDGTT